MSTTITQLQLWDTSEDPGEAFLEVGVVKGDSSKISKKVSMDAMPSMQFVDDIYITVNGKGLVLDSPSGATYRITVADDGTITSAPFP